MILEQEIKIEFVCESCGKRCIQWPDALYAEGEMVKCHQCGVWNKITKIDGIQKEE